jgi:putative oxidoreductase
MAPFVGFVEIACGSLLLIGLWTRLASLFLLLNISVAIATTKAPMLLQQGFWAAAHEARADYAMFLGLVFLLWVGGGEYSITHWLKDKKMKASKG